MQFSLDNVRKAIVGLKEDLGEGFIKTDIWNAQSMKSIAFNHSRGLLPNYGAVPSHIKIFSNISQMLKKTLVVSDYPYSIEYIYLQLANNQVIVILYYNISAVEASDSKSGQLNKAGNEMSEYQQFIWVDMNHTTVGALMGIAIPNILENIR
jgi:hypothetical protein